MSQFSNPSRIKRVGVVVEMQDGSRAMFFSEDPGAEVIISSERDLEGQLYGYPYSDPRISSMLHTIEISNLSTYTMQYTNPEQTAQSIEGIKAAIDGGSPQSIEQSAKEH